MESYSVLWKFSVYLSPLDTPFVEKELALREYTYGKQVKLFGFIGFF